MNPSDHTEKKVILKDGTPALLRPICPSDKDLIGQGFLELGKETVRQRFHGPKKSLGDKELDFLTQVDGVHHYALGALSADQDAPDGMGVARYVRLKDHEHIAELAITVKDRYQDLGLGTYLLQEICEHAVKNKIQIFQGIINTSNTRMMALLKKRSGFQLKTIAPGTLELYGPLVEEHLISGCGKSDEPHKKGKSNS